MKKNDFQSGVKKAAIKYQKMGLSVLPLTHYKKHPSFDWTAWQKKIPTLDEIYQWFNDINITGIALICGSVSGIGVIDDDNYKNGKPLPISSAYEVITASGGRHLYYKYNPTVRNTSNFSEGYTGEVRNQDLIVVLPPSKVKNKLGKIGEYTWVDKEFKKVDDLPLLSEELISPFLTKPSTQYPTMAELVQAPEGSRHNSLLQIAQRAYYCYPQDEWSEAAEFIRDVAAHYDPPLAYDEVERIIKDGANFKLQKMSIDRSYLTSEGAKLSNDPALENNFNPYDVNRSAGYQFNPKKLGDYKAEEFEVDYLWEGVIAKGRITILAAFAKAGKTTLISHLIKQMNDGGELANRLVSPTKVLILTEESVSDWLERKKELNFNDDLKIQSYPVLGALSEKQWMNMMNDILEYCVTEGIELVIFDTISAMWSVEDENSSVQINRAFYGLRLLVQNNLGVLLVHHTTKKAASGGKAVRGSGAINANCDFIVEFNRNGNSGTQRKLKVMSRLQKEFEVTIELALNTYITVGNAKRPSWENNANALLTLLPKSEPGLTIKDIHNAWNELSLGKRPSTRTIDRYIEGLLKRGKVKTGKSQKVAKTEATTYIKVVIK